MATLTGLVLAALLPRSASYQVALAPVSASAASAHGAVSGAARPAGAPWPETIAAVDAVDRLLLTWDDAAADALFSENIALDSPYHERRHVIGLIRERIGSFGVDGARPAESDTPAHRRWWLTGDRGTVQAQIQLSPQRPPRVQSLTLAVPPAKDSVLARTLAVIVEWLNVGAGAWPAALPISAYADAGLIARRLRMAGVWAGSCTAGAYRAGDGGASTAVELVGEHGTIVLSLLVNPATGELRQADVTLQPAVSGLS